MKEKTKSDLFKAGSYILLIGCFTVFFVYLLVYGQRNAEQLEFIRTKAEYDLIQTAILKTSEGDISITLNAGGAPISVYSFVSLSQNGFYNDSIFGNAVVDYYAEGGKRVKQTTTTDSGIVLRHLKDTFRESDSEIDPATGDVLLVNAGSSRKEYHFLIVTTDNPILLQNLKGKYPLVGKVTSGLDVVNRIEALHQAHQQTTLEGVKVL
jgi:peptidyl-prolyl cis-trans isomerase B (cyclophilin B)